MKKASIADSGNILYIPDKYLGHTLSLNAKSFFFRKYSKEHYYTNNFGWRVNFNKTKEYKFDFFITGASLALGTGVEFKDTIGNLLSKRINKKIANLGVGNYSNTQILRKIDISATKTKPKVVIILFEDYMGRNFRQNGLLDISHRPFFKRNIETNNYKLIEPNIIPYFFFKRFVNLEKKKRLKKLNFFNKIEKGILWFFFQFQNKRITNFILRIIGFNKYEYIKTDDKNGRVFILNFIGEKINQLVKKYNFKVLIYPIYPYMGTKKRINRFYKEIDLLSKIIKKQKNSYKILINKTKDLEKAHNLFFKKNKIKNKEFIGTLQWSDNNHPTPKGTKIYADCIYKSLIKFKLI